MHKYKLPQDLKIADLKSERCVIVSKDASLFELIDKVRFEGTPKNREKTNEHLPASNLHLFAIPII